MKVANNVVRLEQYRQKFNEDDIYNKCRDRWINIKRACDPTKTIVAEAVLYIAAIEFLFLKNSSEVIFDSDLLLKKFVKGPDQRARYRKQLGDLYNIKWHPKYEYQGKIYKDVFSCTRTENSIEILNDPKGFYSRKNAEVPGQKCGSTPANLRGLYIDIDEGREELEEPSTRVHSSSLGEYARAEDTSKDLPCLPYGAASLSPVIPPVEASKQARGLAMEEVSTIATEPTPPPITPPPALTAEQEREQLKAHKTRRQESKSDEPRQLGATILSLLPRFGLEDERTTRTYQKGVDFQLEVENSKVFSTPEHVITAEIEASNEYQTQAANSTTEEDKMAPVKPYRDEEPEWAKDFKIQMTSDCQFEYPIDFWEYKAALRYMDLEWDQARKVMVLSGSSFDINDLRKKHLKAFGTRFYEILPDHIFKFEEIK